MESTARFPATSLVLVFCMILAPAVFARDAMGEGRPKGESYFKLQAGAVTSGGETDWSINGVYGRYILNNVALEGSVGYYSADYSYGEQTVWPVSFSIKAGIPLDRFFPYGIAGVDVHFIDADQDGRSDSDTATGYHVGGGVEFSLSRNVYAGFEYRYTFMETTLFGEEHDLDGGEGAFTLGFRF